MRNDDTRVLRRIRELRVADRGKREIADCSATFPALETRFRDDAFGLRVRIDPFE